MSLNITDIRIFPLKEGRGQTVGFATITLDGYLVIEDWRIIDGKNGLFVTGPAKKTTEGEWRSTVRWIDKEVEKEFQAQVIAAYKGLNGGPVKPVAGKPATKKAATSAIPRDYDFDKPASKPDKVVKAQPDTEIEKAPVTDADAEWPDENWA